MTPRRVTSGLALLTASLLLAVGCGEEAKRVQLPPKDPKDFGVAKARAREPIREVDQDIDGWTSTSWEELGGAPVALPSLQLPGGTTFVSVLEYSGPNADVADVSGTTTDSRELTLRRIASQFEGWEEDEERRRVSGAWDKGERSAEVTVRSEADGTFFLITVANRHD